MALSGFGLAHKKLIFFQGISGSRHAGTTLAFAVTLSPPPPPRRTMSHELTAALGADAVSNHTEKPAAQGRRACVFYKLIVESIIQEKQLVISLAVLLLFFSLFLDFVLCSLSTFWLYPIRNLSRKFLDDFVR